MEEPVTRRGRHRYDSTWPVLRALVGVGASLGRDLDGDAAISGAR
jgi:hypothetical protein